MDFYNLIKEFNDNYKTKLVFYKVSFFKLENELEITFLRNNDLKDDLIKKFFEEELSNLGVNTVFKIISLEEILDRFKKSFKNININLNNSNLEIDFSSEMEFNTLSKNLNYRKYIEIFEKFELNISNNILENINNNIDQLKNNIEESLSKEITKAKESIEKKELKVEKEKLFRHGFFKSAPKEFSDIKNIKETDEKISVKGRVYEIEYKKIRDMYFVNFDIDDGYYAISCKLFLKEKNYEYFINNFKEGMGVIASGIYNYDTFKKNYLLNVSSIEEVILPEKLDLEENKRIEFNIHSKYTNLESVVDINELFRRLKNFGHKSVGITDLFNVQAYPEIYKVAKKNNIKLNLGLQTNILEIYPSILTNYENIEIKDREIVIFDIETTGLSNFTDKIIEIGAVKIKDNKIVSNYQKFINPQEPLSDFTTELTGITNDMVANADTIDVVLPEFINYCKDTVLVAHNAEFDMGFIIAKSNELNLDFKPPYLDTLYLSRALNPEFKNHKLDTLATNYKVSLLNHHRACDDAKATAEILLKMINELKSKNIDLDKNINQIETSFPKGAHKEYQNIFYAKNKIGLKNLYIIVSKSNIEYYNREPGIPLDILKKYRDGLLIGTGNYKSKLFYLVSLEYSDEVLLDELSKFDFVVLNPIDFSQHLIKKGYIKDQNHFERINKKLLELSLKQNKLAIAMGDVYYLDSKDYPFRNIMKNFPRKKGQENSGAFYFKNTLEMLNQFSYLSEKDQQDVVIFNTHKLDNQIENFSPIADGTFPPKIDNAEDILREETYSRAKNIYGENLPDIVKSRLDRELNSIISNGYASLYIIARMLVKKSNEDGYQVGSRGSVGSSFVATMADITEVNPLPPHYVCNDCKYSEFIEDEKYGTGIDLPEKKCPICGSKLYKDGFDIPFETFLGFSGDKEPDIDLNFASVYQSKIHKYTEKLFGSDKVFRAGTLGTIANKTAYGMVEKYKTFYEDDDTIRIDQANKNRVKRNIVGVKRTTGQHAGGLIIVPQDKDIEDFTPVQYPADKKETGIITTHFDYHAIDKNLLKLDLLGHNSPTIIRLLSDMSGVDAVKIDLSDKDTMSIFSSTEKLGIKHDYSNINNGSLGIPEFGTNFVRGMLEDTKPTTFEELIRISGLSHGTDVWLGNAQELIRNNICDLKSAICTRDDIMLYLIFRGLDKKLSFDIMESVRKGKGLTEDQILEMRSKKIDEWYIDSCLKIKYMFPKAHAVAYVMMSYRIAYFKVHLPAYFYAVTFTNSIDSFEYTDIKKGLNYLTMLLKSIKSNESMDDESYSKSDEDIKVAKIYIYELAEEMYARGIKLEKVDLYKSHPLNFEVIDENTILPPLMAIENVSENMALRIEESRNEGEFISKEDFIKRTKINKTALNSLEEAGILNNMQATNQMDFFSL